ncbi:MAG: heparinase II/III family protein [Armatimonadia bacterium]
MDLSSWLVLLLVVLLAAGAAEAAEPLDPARLKQLEAMLPDQPIGLGQPLTDRAAWSKLAQTPAYQALLKRAETLLATPLPDQPDELFLDFSKTGNRDRWQNVAFARRGRLAPLVLAECVEDKGRFLPAIEQLATALCAEPTWVMPAHDAQLTNFNGTSVDIDLASSALAWDLATAAWLLGDRLSAPSRETIRGNVQRRVLAPYRDMFTAARPVNWWMLTTSNWNAVCLAGVTGAALAQIPSRAERAQYVAAAELYSRNFLKGFTPDGYCSEGVGYWNYGFGRYVLLAETLRQATFGKLDLLLLPEVKAPASFGANIMVDDTVCPAFADCSVKAMPDPTIMYFVNRRLQLGLPRWDDLNLASALGSLSEAMILSFPNGASETKPAPATASGRPLRSWFPDAGILVARPRDGSPTSLAAAMKGGHNAEHHNHNDVGSYTVFLGGRTPLVDPGGEVYTARTFSARRYESNLLNSFGHPVPLVAGKQQSPGAKYRATVLAADFTDATDTLKLDLKAAYEVPELEALTRTFTYSREANASLIVQDDVEFTSPQAFETALIVRSGYRRNDDGSLFVYDVDQAVRVEITCTGGDFELIEEQIKEDSAVKPLRVAIRLKQPVTTASLKATITPIAPPTSGNLLVNGGFEQAAFGWELPANGQGEISTERAFEGKAALKIADDRTDNGSNLTSGRLPATGEKDYVLKGQVFHVSGSGIGMYMRFYDAAGNSLNPADDKGNIAPVGSLTGPANQWTAFTYPFRTPAGTTNMRLWIHSFSATKVEAYLDNLEISAAQ